MAKSRSRRDDQRREWTLWVLYAADMAGVSGAEMYDRLEAAFVGPVPAPTALEATEHFRVVRFEDFLPEPDQWKPLARDIRECTLAVDLNRAEIDAYIAKASPRWRIDRMPAIDRNLLRIGVAEMLYQGSPRPKATFNGLIELAKAYGEHTSARFVNGILDQIRRNLEIPFQ